jgi:hypothetical protein
VCRVTYGMCTDDTHAGIVASTLGMVENPWRGSARGGREGESHVMLCGVICFNGM